MEELQDQLVRAASPTKAARGQESGAGAAVKLARARGVLRYGLSVLFLCSGAAKLLGADAQVQRFSAWGFPAGTRETVGAIELSMALALAVPRSAQLGALGLAGIMVGACLTHLRTPSEAPFAVVPALLGLALAPFTQLGASAPRAIEQAATRRRGAPALARPLATFVALVTLCTPFFADWNDMHLFNERWTAHAKFHSAHTVSIGALLGLLSLWLTWRRGAARVGVLVAATFWAAQALAITFPGTAFVDPEFAARLPQWRGVPLNQLAIDALLLGISWLAFRLARTDSSETSLYARGPART